MRDIDLFAGPGGWDEGARELGIRPLGIEWDDAACATRRAAGHETLQADVSALDPLDFAPCRLLIASPPCQAFSMAGKGAGRRALDAYVTEIRRLVESGVVDREGLDARCSDPRAHLVLEPLRWVLKLRPRFVACEQVSPVLPLWEAMAEVLSGLGYGTWAGVLSAECFGVPQTRKRAILLACLGGVVSAPPASHQRYVPPRRARVSQEGSLFEPPVPERVVLAEDRELLPWVSMAEALGWGMTARPFPVVANHHADGGVDYSCVGGSQARQRIYDERDAGRWMRANAQPNAAVRSAGEPAPTITGGHDTADRVWVAGQERVVGPSRDPERARGIDEPSYTIRTATGSGDAGVGRTPGVQWVTDTGNTRSGTRAEGRSRPADEPAPTVTTRADQLEWRDDPPADVPTHMNTGRDWKPGGSREDAQKIPTSDPAPAITAKLGGQAQWVRARDDREDEPRDPDWPSKRPATTVAGDPRLAQPGHKNEQAMPDCPGRMEGAIRVSVREASVLQSFPADYPWQGSRTAQYRQIGDAMPPLLARAVLGWLVR